MHPFSSCNHSLPATNVQYGHFCPFILPTQAHVCQTVAHHCPNNCPPLLNSCPPLPKQLPTIAQAVAHHGPNTCPQLAHVCPPWDAMLTGSTSRILETFCESLTEWLRVSCPPVTPQMVFFACLHLLLYDSHTSDGRRSNRICHATQTHGS